MSYVTCFNTVNDDHAYVVNCFKSIKNVRLMVVHECEHITIFNDLLPDVISNLIADYCSSYDIFKLILYKFADELYADVWLNDVVFVNGFKYVICDNDILITSYRKLLTNILPIINWLDKSNMS